MLAVTLAAQLLLFKGKVPLKPYLNEIFFIQNYRFGIWAHTWSLAVEEHFYIILPALLLILIQIASRKADPFRAIPWIFVFIAAGCLAIRIVTISTTPSAVFRTSWVMNPTQCRIDGLFFGVFLGYLYHFRREKLDMLFGTRRNQLLFALLTAVLLSTCAFYTRDDRFLLTFGLTFLYLGFGLLLMLALYVRGIFSGFAASRVAWLGKVCAYVGMYSYSIYLWHMMLIQAIYIPLHKPTVHVPFAIPRSVLLAVYLLGSIALGIFFAKLVEFPVLRIRDRVFPALQRPPVSPNPPLATAVETRVSV